MEGMSEDVPEGMAVGRLVGTAVAATSPYGHGGWRPEGGLRGGSAADDGAQHLSRTELAMPRLWLWPTQRN